MAASLHNSAKKNFGHFHLKCELAQIMLLNEQQALVTIDEDLKKQ